MRLQQYINEAAISPVDHINKIKKDIQDKCKPYLTLTKNGKIKFYRGMSVKYYDHNQYAGIKNTRKNRKSSGMTSDQADNVNNWLEFNGHTRRDRSSVFVTGSIRHAKRFSKSLIYVIYPIGNFNYTYIKTKDINLSAMTEYGDAIKALKNNKNVDNYNDQLKKLFVTNKNIKTAYNKNYEIWFECDSYYYLAT